MFEFNASFVILSYLPFFDKMGINHISLYLIVCFFSCRKLDEPSLFNASKVDKVWTNVIKSDKVLRTRLRKYVRTLRDFDPLNLRRFERTGQQNKSRRTKSNSSEFSSANTFRIADLDISRPLKRRRHDGGATSGVNKKIKVMRF